MEHLVFQIVMIVVLAVLAQLLSWKLAIPSILVLLLTGLASGPGFNIISPDHIFGDLLPVLVSLSVAIILFEGGLTLHFRDIPKVGSIVTRLVTLGAVVSWFGITFTAYYILSLPLNLSFLLGAILVVTGPTVIIPLMRQLRPKSPLGSILHWEGILIDPIGVILAVIVAEIIADTTLQLGTSHLIFGIAKGLFVGTAGGLVGGYLVAIILKRRILPDHLLMSLTFGTLLTVFTISNHFAAESGLISVTLMGFIIGNKTGTLSKPISEFFSHIQVVLISLLFIILSARIDPKFMMSFDASSFLFIGILILVIRPLSVVFSTFGSNLNFKERIFLGTVAPRGIVAASLSSVLSVALLEKQIPHAELILPYTFLAIVSTVTFSGLLSPIICSMLGLRQKNPQGVLIVGAHIFGRELAKSISKHEFRVVLIDSNPQNVRAVRRIGLESYMGNALSEALHDQLDFDGIGKMVALTPNDEANTLAVIEFSHFFGKKETYQLLPTSDSPREDPIKAHGRILFSRALSFSDIDRLWDEGYRISEQIIDLENKEITIEEIEENTIVLGIIRPDVAFVLRSADIKSKIKDGDILITFTKDA